MAKGRRGAKLRRRGFRAIPVDKGLTLSTLANETILAGDLLDDTFTDSWWLISADLWIMHAGLTPGEGPLMFGISHSDLSVAEIKEALINDIGSMDNIVAQEQASRPVRKVGIASGIAASGVLNDGRTTRVKLGFHCGNGFTPVIWVQNKSGGTLTTGASITVMGTIYCRRQ